MHSVFDGIWGNSANVLGQTDLAMTWDFGPVHDQVVGLQTAARAILLFALILLGLRSMLSGHHPAPVERRSPSSSTECWVPSFWSRRSRCWFRK